MGEGTEQKRKKTLRALYGIFIAVVATFVLSNIWQVAGMLYGEQTSKVEGACRAAVDELVRSVDTPDQDKVWSRYTDSAKACDGDPNGASALAAAQRYARAAARHKSDLSTVRRAAESFIR